MYLWANFARQERSMKDLPLIYCPDCHGTADENVQIRNPCGATLAPLIENRTQACIASAGGPVSVLACGLGWVVVNKPGGLSIHNDPGRDLCSVLLAAVQRGCLPAMGGGLNAIHAAHRLDRDTSGVVLFAGDPERLAFFGDQFAARDVHKHYLAVVHGRLEGRSANREWMDWRWPLTAAAAGRNDPVGRGKRIPCATRWRVLDHSIHFTLIECQPLTGRKHQIRRHAKLAGHPVVGDRRYGSVRSRDYLSRHFNFRRLGLHAHSLTIRLPGENQTTTFHSGGLPCAMGQLLDADRQLLTP